MKNTKIKSISICFLFLFLAACSQTNSPKKDILTAKKNNLTTEMFTGNYKANYENATISAELTEKNTVVNGYFYMDGVQNQLIAISDKNTLKGKIKDKSKNMYYDFTANLNANELHFFITFPELNNQIIELLLIKQEISSDVDNDLTSEKESKITPTQTTDSNINSTINSKTKDKRLVGTWRYTDVISSGGYGGDYASLSTDYFVQFKPNGECLSWSGSSAGGSGDITYDSSGNSNITVEGWYTEGKNIVFYNLSNNEEVSIPFLVDDTRFLLKGGSTKIYQRVK